MQHVCTRTPEHTCCTPSHMRVNTHTALAGSERQSGHGADAKRLDANAIAQGKATKRDKAPSRADSRAALRCCTASFTCHAQPHQFNTMLSHRRGQIKQTQRQRSIYFFHARSCCWLTAA